MGKEVGIDDDIMDAMNADEEFLGLVGVQVRHRVAMLKIEETKELEISYQSWRDEAVELTAGELYRVDGLTHDIVVRSFFFSRLNLHISNIITPHFPSSVPLIWSSAR